jgi:hypothetical protein
MTLVGLLNEGGLGISMNHGWMLSNRKPKRQRGKSANQGRQFLFTMTSRIVRTLRTTARMGRLNKHKRDSSMKHCYPAIFWRNYDLATEANSSLSRMAVGVVVLASSGIPA